MKKIWFTWIFSLFVIPCVLAQNIGLTFKMADSLMNCHQYNQALSLYERVVFFDQKGQFDDDSYGQIAKCAYQIGDYEKASKNYFIANRLSGKNDYWLDGVLCSILGGDLMSAKIDLLGERFEEHPTELKRLALLSVVEFRLGDYQKAESYFNKVLIGDSLIDYSHWSISRDARKIERKFNPKKMKALSLIVPGLGQALSGDIGDGLNSASITSVFLVFYFGVSLNVGILDAAIIVLPWYSKYYIGGYQNGGKAAKSRIFQEMGLLEQIMMRRFGEAGIF